MLPALNDDGGAAGTTRSSAVNGDGDGDGDGEMRFFVPSFKISGLAGSSEQIIEESFEFSNTFLPMGLLPG